MCKADHLFIVEIQAGHGIAALWLAGLFFERDGAPGRIKGHHAVSLWIRDRVGKDRGTGGLCCGPREVGAKLVAVEEVVAEDERTGPGGDEVFAD